jgi:hypothetical protein
MNQRDIEQFEHELQKFKPAQPPEDFMARLSSEAYTRKSQAKQLSAFSALLASLRFDWFKQHGVRWAVPASALIAVLLALAHFVPHRPVKDSKTSSVQAPAIKADEVQINHELVSTFDAVARLPDGEPVRFRCRQWMDEVVLSDNGHGVTIEQRSPRVEIVPVGFDTY